MGEGRPRYINEKKASDMDLRSLPCPYQVLQPVYQRFTCSTECLEAITQSSEVMTMDGTLPKQSTSCGAGLGSQAKTWVPYNTRGLSALGQDQFGPGLAVVCSREGAATPSLATSHGGHPNRALAWSAKLTGGLHMGWGTPVMNSSTQAIEFGLGH